MQIARIREEIKFLYKKKDKLNESLYKTHLQRPWNGGEARLEFVYLSNTTVWWYSYV